MPITRAAEWMQTQNRIIKSFPGLASVYGKAGCANTATDPAATDMLATVFNLKPEPEWRAGMTIDKLIAELDQALPFPGVANARTLIASTWGNLGGSHGRWWIAEPPAQMLV